MCEFQGKKKKHALCGKFKHLWFSYDACCWCLLVTVLVSRWGLLLDWLSSFLQIHWRPVLQQTRILNEWQNISKFAITIWNFFVHLLFSGQVSGEPGSSFSKLIKFIFSVISKTNVFILSFERIVCNELVIRCNKHYFNYLPWLVYWRWFCRYHSRSHSLHRLINFLVYN